MRRFWVVVLVLLLSVVAVIAQECPTLEQAAVGETRAWCVNVAVGEACYGNSIASAEFTSFADDDLAFSAPGDTVALTDIASLSTAVEENRYGVSLIRTTGYPLNSWQPQAITMFLLGDVAISDNSSPLGYPQPHQLTVVSAVEGVNIRAESSSDARVITSVLQNELIMLVGRSPDNSWMRVLLRDGRVGWAIAEALRLEDVDLELLEVNPGYPDNDGNYLFEPFTIFGFDTGIQDARCSNAWESGILVQNSGGEPLPLRANTIDFSLNGTAFLQATSSQAVVGDIVVAIHVIDGEVMVGNAVVEEGYQAQILIGADGMFSDTLIEPYDFARMAHLPTEILPRYTYIGIDLSTIITPAPNVDRSPIIDTLVTEPCVLTTGQGGANLRSGPGSEFPIRGVLDFRQTANPIGRTTGSDGAIWWELAQNIWINGAVVVTGGDCAAVPQSQRIPNPPPTATPEN